MRESNGELTTATMDVVTPPEEPEATPTRRRLLVRGVVQGVGFRPYVFRLAQRHGLSGFVQNTSLGVVIEIEGAPQPVDAFERALPAEGPPLMRIVSLTSATIPCAGERSFAILESDGAESALAWVPADVSVCAACLEDIGDEHNRRYAYPFTNCTDCGPRYSIILDLPYDRGQTTMASFPMCAECEAEYRNPADRRFHAQPNACPRCGPELFATGLSGDILPLRSTRAILDAAIGVLRGGGIVAWKGLGGYQLACDARNQRAVEELRRRKHRNQKAFAVMVQDVATAAMLCELSDAERALLLAPERAIVLLRKRPDSPLAESVAPDSNLFGLMLPCTPMHELLFRWGNESCGPGWALVMTSGNLSEEPIAIDEQEAQNKLGAVADLLLHHNRPIHNRVDDSVVRLVEGTQTILRRARGFAPGAIALGGGDAQVLAVGAQQKSTLCLTKAGFAIMSQHLGDLENVETLAFFEQTLNRMQQLFQIAPNVIAHDLHPAYLSTQFALGQQATRHIAVQHHHAHIASCMAEHSLEGQVIGIAWDGTGFGSDGTIWGGEFLIAALEGFERYAQLRNVTLPGGDHAVREPWRVARSYLLDAFDGVVPSDLRYPPPVPEKSLGVVDALIERRIHTFETSSCGRLFDAVASIIGLHQVVSFEGQAAMALEAIAGGADETYEFAMEGTAPLQLNMRPMTRQIVDEVKRGEPTDRIAARFHNTLVVAASEVCSRIRAETGLTRVCLSGGCFQNARLLSGCVRELTAAGFQVFFQQQVPCNDGGIALGQAAIANALLREGL